MLRSPNFTVPPEASQAPTWSWTWEGQGPALTPVFFREKTPVKTGAASATTLQTSGQPCSSTPTSTTAGDFPPGQGWLQRSHLLDPCHRRSLRHNAEEGRSLPPGGRAIHESHHLERDNGPPHHQLYGGEDIIRSMRHFRPLGYGKKLDTADFQRSLETPVTP